jgi:hypothetical protein
MDWITRESLKVDIQAVTSQLVVREASERKREASDQPKYPLQDPPGPRIQSPLPLTAAKKRLRQCQKELHGFL